ncbi:MAG: hypothetical protein SOR77_05810 [Peptoniphilus sp.]|uniref:hypothetical protein n=1 Tax=Peptoniphilus sp. TaxID=1971214 RepID=UPI002A74774F|nr:hypothetical protein [Peptoniphilus sp.]MDY2987135.1 hypothetical protein [Peptoniphilus sp.]
MKKVFYLGLLVLSLVIVTSNYSFAKENETIGAKDVPVTLDELEHLGEVAYFNENTGEYFVWLDKTNEPSSLTSATYSNSSLRNFSFKIRYSLDVGYIYVPTSSIQAVIHDAYIGDSNSTVMNGFNDYPYALDFSPRGLFGGQQTITMNIATKKIGYLDGLRAGSDYYLTVRNPGRLPDGLYIYGSGSIFAN